MIKIDQDFQSLGSQEAIPSSRASSTRNGRTIQGPTAWDLGEAQPWTEHPHESLKSHNDYAPERRRLAELHHCTSCHRAGLVGQQQAPRLVGQDYDYLLKLLRGFKAKTASDLDGTMTIATQPLSDEEIVSLVHFIASLGAGR